MCGVRMEKLRVFSGSGGRWLAAVVVFLACAGLARATDWRKHAGLTRATAVEKVLAARFPRARVEWGATLRVAFPGSEPTVATFPGFEQRPVANGFMFATALELPEQKRRIWEGARAGTLGTAIDGTTWFFAFLTDPQGELRGYRCGTLEGRATPTQCETLHVLRLDDAGWPVIQVVYWTLHRSDAGVAAIEWAATYATDPPQQVERLPRRRIAWQPTGEAKETVYLLGGRTESSLEFKANGSSLWLDCKEPCVIPAAALLSR